MNLLDHFSMPVAGICGWPAVHHGWSAAVAERLNDALVPPWRAEPHLFSGFEVDVAGVERELPDPLHEGLTPTTFDPPPATGVVPLNPLGFEVEIEIFQSRGGRSLVAAIEFVSPANKIGRANRAAFAAKCESLLSRGLGVCIVDTVTEARRSLYAALLHRTGVPDPPDDAIYAVSLHPLERGGELTADVWYHPLSVGGPLPTLPLFLKGGPCLKVDLQEAYDLAVDRLKLGRDLAHLQAARDAAGRSNHAAAPEPAPA